MAFYIKIRKIAENAEFVDYSFGDPEEDSGTLRISKADGEIMLVQAAPNDANHRRFFRAASKVRQHRESGEYPEVTCWAS